MSRPYGCAGFNGAQEFAFTKAALEQGLPVTSPFFNVAYENMGKATNLYPIPANAPFQPAAASCFSGSYAGVDLLVPSDPGPDAGPFAV